MTITVVIPGYLRKEKSLSDIALPPKFVSAHQGCSDPF